MPTTKSSSSKSKKVAPKVDATNDDIGPEIDPINTKNKKLIEIYEPEPITAGVEEKIEEDPLIAAVEEEDGEEAVSLDGEELNPFGDRWEE